MPDSVSGFLKFPYQDRISGSGKSGFSKKLKNFAVNKQINVKLGHLNTVT